MNLAAKQVHIPAKPNAARLTGGKAEDFADENSVDADEQ